MTFRTTLLLALGLGSALGCTSAEAEEERALLAAIEALRNAPAEDLGGRKNLLSALEKKPARSPEAQRARDGCAEAYRLLLEGKEGTEGVKRALGGGGPVPTTLLADLAAAEEKIKKSSEQAMPACEKAAAELRLRRR
ncbi:hypothetical protein [Polyangium jinanense]|uniref:Uncharacterized protein n=1 Tax=Polyangium jinanense TaxID=2829994 RepID=A0A9X3X143_9BACT|nr:hypothetical protein [Polyangium jinanense]MDC3953354.1 hypothetical protein [Polyangium jinanense]MDC3979526.1 hypothetical protein [Polyangium jinanense]